MSKFSIYNSLSRRKEEFIPINPPHVGLYVCGPTVYGDPHLGHARPAITFDLLFRYLKYLNYKVRYVRNITDVGHLEADADSGDDKIAKKARLEQLEPMEIVQYYTNRYHDIIGRLNVLPPSIEPHASGHIIEQIEMVRQILKAGYAYESNGSVYFDVEKYDKKYNYGKISGRKTEDLLSNTRELEGQQEKRNPLDFAIWKKAEPTHIMRWPSEWSDGFPGWHLECSAMSAKYLGETFDIHGGGMDLLFPHHECEIAQSVAATGHETVKYWMHNNMITVNGQKMGKSLGNFINLDDFFSGNNSALTSAYSPMTVRFFILQAQYRSTLDFSNDALQAAEKGLKRLMSAVKSLDKITPVKSTSFDTNAIITGAFDAMNDDLNSPIAIACLFDGVRAINSLVDKKECISEEDLKKFRDFYHTMVFDILGLLDEDLQDKSNASAKLVDFILNIRSDAKTKKDFATSDKIRDELKAIGIVIKDGKDGVVWEWE
jgi:cysteinyl-tRNA synthetase